MVKKNRRKLSAVAQPGLKKVTHGYTLHKTTFVAFAVVNGPEKHVRE